MDAFQRGCHRLLYGRCVWNEKKEGVVNGGIRYGADLREERIVGPLLQNRSEEIEEECKVNEKKRETEFVGKRM